MAEFLSGKGDVLAPPLFISGFRVKRHCGLRRRRIGRKDVEAMSFDLGGGFE